MRFMDGIRRINSDPNISFTDVSENTNDANITSSGGIAGASDQIERADSPTLAPDWTSGNQSDPGITLLQVPKFLSESLLYRADQIAQRSPHLASVATSAAEPFYQKTTESMKNSNALDDASLVHDNLANVAGENYNVLGNMNNQDIEAIAFLVLMAASKSAQEDLKAIMANVKAINNAKAQQRENLADMQKYTSGASDGSDGQKDVLNRFLTSTNDALSVYEAKWNQSDDDPDKK
jgi:hypothetical protein